MLAPRLRHKQWFVQSRPQKWLQGAIRGIEVRERVLEHSLRGWRFRRTRKRLLAVYYSRFGEDTFYRYHVALKLPVRAKSNWLPNGYAHWRERIIDQPSTSPTAATRVER